MQNTTTEKSANASLKLQLSEEAVSLRRAESALSCGTAREKALEQQVAAVHRHHTLQHAEASSQEQRAVDAVSSEHRAAVQQQSAQLRQELAEAARQIQTSADIAAESGKKALDARCSASQLQTKFVTFEEQAQQQHQQQQQRHEEIVAKLRSTAAVDITMSSAAPVAPPPACPECPRKSVKISGLELALEAARLATQESKTLWLQEILTLRADSDQKLQSAEAVAAKKTELAELAARQKLQKLQASSDLNALALKQRTDENSVLQDSVRAR